jgi:hypothetical protein
VACHRKNAIEVEPGFFLAELPNNTVTDIAVWPCPRTAACLGGLEAGQVSCAEGNEDVMCGICSTGYFRGRDKCVACSDSGTGDEIKQSMSLAGAFVFMVVALWAVYLVQGTRSPAEAKELHRHCHHLRLAWRALMSQTSLVANVLRIVLGYVQCAPPRASSHQRAQSDRARSQ